jgi:hypothetical protein
VAQAKRADVDAGIPDQFRDGAIRGEVRTWRTRDDSDDRGWTHVSARDGDVEFTVSVRGRFDLSKEAVDEIAERLYLVANDNFDVLVNLGLIRIEWASTR